MPATTKAKRTYKTKPTSAKKTTKRTLPLWDVDLYGTWHRGSTTEHSVKGWTRRLSQEFIDERYNDKLYTYVLKERFPAMKVKLTGAYRRNTYDWEPRYADSGTFEIEGVEVRAATEAGALKAAQAIVRRRLSAQMCTPPRLVFT